VAIAADRQKQWAITMALGLVANLALNVPLIALFDRAYANGAIGLALAAVISEAVLIVLGVRLLPAGVIGRPVLLAAVRSVGASLLMVAVMVATRAVIDPGFLPLLALGALVYFAALLALRGVTIGEIRFLLATFTYGRREREEPQPVESGAGLSIGTRVEEGGSVR
jgi:O-antigen/teichoic acid export membrane protein